MSRSKILHELQKIDSQLDQHQSRQQEIEVALADNDLVHKAQVIFHSAENELNEIMKNLQLAEHEVRTQRIKIEQSESNLYSGKVINPKELQDLQNEIRSFKRFLSVLEDRQLESMLAVDSAQEIYQDKQENLTHARAQGDVRNTVLFKERETIKIDMNRAQDLKKKQWPMIAKDDLRTYQVLRKKRAGIAVTKVANKACSACGTILTEVTFRAARSPNQLVFCDTCDRVLYAE